MHKIYKLLLQDKKEAAGVINYIMKEKMVKSEELEKCQFEFELEGLVDHEPDAVYKLKNMDRYFLIIHKSDIDYSIVSKVYYYIAKIIVQVFDNKNEKEKEEFEIPEMIPIVLYTGKKKWELKQDSNEIQINLGNYIKNKNVEN